MTSSYGALPPHFLDDRIESKRETRDARQIAMAIATCPELIAAIEAGLEYNPPPGMMGPSKAQYIRQKIQEIIARG